MKSLIQMTNIINQKGYEVLTIKDNNKYRCMVFYFGEFLKIGEINYECWKQAYKNTVTVIYNKTC